MKRILLLGAVCALVAVPVTAHVPDGVINTAFQWPAGVNPTLDGDLSEGDLVPTDYHLGMAPHLDQEGNADYDFADLNMKIIVGYSADTDLLYFMMERFDDHYDRDGQGGGAGGDDSWEIHVDADHTGDLMRVSADVIEDETERNLAQGRGAQAYHTRFPPLGDTGGDSWTWFWMSQATWHTDPQFGDFGFQLDGSLNSGEATAYIEFSKAAWDDFIFTGAAASTLHDFVPEEIIGLGWQVVDHDGNGPDASVDKNWYFSGATDAWRTAASASDFLLAPVDPRVDFTTIPTAVESQTWGRIKAGFVQ